MSTFATTAPMATMASAKSSSSAAKQTRARLALPRPTKWTLPSVRPRTASTKAARGFITKAVSAPLRPKVAPDVTESQAATAEKIGVSLDTIRFGFPKGSLQEATEDLFARAGYSVKVKSRNYFPSIDDDNFKLILFRSQEIPRYVEDGVLDAGICGQDWVVENGSDVIEVCELKYSKATSNPARWVIAVPEDSHVQTAADLAGTIVCSELVQTTEKFFADRGIAVKKVEYSWGATEVKAGLPGIGAIVDITETGSSLVANKLRIVDTILASTTRLVANRAAWEDPEKRRKIEDLALLLQGAIDGRTNIGLKMNLRADRVKEFCQLLPSEQSPTVSALIDSDFVAVEVVVDESLCRQLVATCKRMGATGIVTYPLNVAVH